MTFLTSSLRDWRRMRADRPTAIYTAVIVGLVVLLQTVAFVWHSLHYFSIVSDALPPAFTPWVDGSVPEIVELAITLLAVGCLAVTAVLRRDGLLLAWALLLLTLALDNALRLHESVGAILAPALDPLGFGPIEGRHLGELAFWGGCAAILAIVFVACRRSRTGVGAAASVVLGSLLLLLLLFAAGCDLLHVLTRSNLVGFLEDGGESVVLALMSAYAFAVFRDARAHLSAPAQVAGAPTDARV